MKTIAQFIRDGIKSPDDLKAALQTAMQLEFSTIPPYLCAEWSVDYNNDPDNVMSMIHGVAIQEMYHFALAGNILSAIGGVPAIADAAFVPSYPTNSLPGGIAQTLAVDLLPLSSAQLQVFMQIEKPEFPPIALAAAAPATIGAFYDTIAASLSTDKPTIDPNAYFAKYGSVGQIKSIDDALAAIEESKQKAKGRPNRRISRRSTATNSRITMSSNKSTRARNWSSSGTNGIMSVRRSDFQLCSISRSRQPIRTPRPRSARKWRTC